MFLIIFFGLSNLNKEVTQEAMMGYAMARADSAEEAAYVTSFTTTPGFLFFMFMITIALYVFLAWYVNKKK